MILATTCINCRKNIRVKAIAYDRYELSRVLKIESITCKNCLKHQTIEINKVFAKRNNIFRLILLVLMFGICIYGAYYIFDNANLKDI